MTQDAIDEATDAACGIGNTSGLPVFEGRQRDLIELGLRRLTAAGYRILAPGEIDTDTVEKAVKAVESVVEDLAEGIGEEAYGLEDAIAALRSLQDGSK